jgi:hypothetical protein
MELSRLKNERQGRWPVGIWNEAAGVSAVVSVKFIYF